MPVFSAKDFDDHEQVVFCAEPQSGLRAIIAVHDTTRGPALGGCRMWRYRSEAAAVTDALRLSRAMTYKNALAGLPLGGGKAVVIGDPGRDKSPVLLRAMGECVDRLDGRYITAEDVGTGPDDMAVMRERTAHVAGLKEGGSGDPAPATALGVFAGIRAAVSERLRRGDLGGLRVAVQGLGGVGYELARRLHGAGARLWVADIDQAAVQRAVADLGAAAAAPDDVYALDVDVFAPCALGAIINDDTIRMLKAKIVAGSANNQLAEDRHGRELARAGVLYAPDYVINAGGVINISYEESLSGRRYDRARAFAHVECIYDTSLEIFARAKAENAPTNLTADRIAEERLCRKGGRR